MSKSVEPRITFIKHLLDIQSHVLELMSEYSNIQIIFENLKVVVQEASAFFEEYIAHHSTKLYIAASIRCIIIYYLDHIELPFEAFLGSLKPRALSKEQLTTLHIKLLVFVG